MTKTKRSASRTTSYRMVGLILGYVLFSVLGQLLFRSLGLPLLTELLIVAVVVLLFMVALRYVIIPWFTRKPSRYHHTTRSEEWSSAADCAAALTAVEKTLREHEPRVRVQVDETGNELHASFGSDAVFRYRGSGSRKGWAALPLAATFRATQDGSGSQIVGEIRDDLGWTVSEPPSFVATEVNHRAATLLRRAREATENPPAEG